METNDSVLEFAPYTSNTSSKSSKGAGLPDKKNAIALQQYEFEQSLISKWLSFHQQTVAQEASIKAAAEQTAAHAAEVGKILRGESVVDPKEKGKELIAKRDVQELQFHSQSPSWQFSRSKSKSASPVRYRKDSKEHEDHSPGDRISYRHHRNFNCHIHFDDYRDDYGSSYRRDANLSGGKSCLHRRRIRSRSRSRSSSRERGRSPSRSRSRRYHHEDSCSPRHGRSPSRSGSRRCHHKDFHSPRHGRSPSRSRSRRCHHEDSCPPRHGHLRAQSHDSRYEIPSSIPSSHRIVMKEDDVDSNLPSNRDVSNHEVDTNGHLNDPAQCAICPLPDNQLSHKSPNKFCHPERKSSSLGTEEKKKSTGKNSTEGIEEKNLKKKMLMNKKTERILISKGMGRRSIEDGMMKIQKGRTNY